jgi:tetratricopeptide (TPR) repeat protein
VNRKLLLGLLTLVFVGQTVYFAGRTYAGFLVLRGQRAYLRNDLVGAWNRAGDAMAAGGPRGVLETRQIEILLAGFHLRDVGIRMEVALADGGEAEARRLLGRRMRETPHLAHLWSLAADFFFHEGRVRRRAAPIDLSRLSEDPMENLVPEDHLGLAALEKAASLEPDNYLYHGLLAEQFVEFGAEAPAERECRLAVASYPRLDAHPYVTGRDLPPGLVQAALDGYQDALLSVSLVARVEILRDAARLLSQNDRDDEAIRFLELATRLDPSYVDARYELAEARVRQGQWKEAERDIEIAIPLLPGFATLHILHARIKRQLGDGEGAVEAYRRARAVGSTDARVFIEQGEVLESLNRGSEARRQFLAAVNLNPTDAFAWMGLLGYARRTGDQAEARRACEHLLASGSVAESVRVECAGLRSSER